MEINGALLNFNKVIKNDHIFPSSCDISIPEKIPVITYLRSPDRIDDAIGTAEVYREDEKLICNATINDRISKELLKRLPNLGLGGFYKIIKEHTNDDGIRIIDSADLRCCIVTPRPADEECTFIIKEEELHEQSK